MNSETIIRTGQFWTSNRYLTRHEVIANHDRNGVRWIMEGPSGRLYGITAADLRNGYTLEG